MAGNLKSRLARLRELGLERAPESQAELPPTPAPAEGAGLPRGAVRPAFLDDWEKLADLVWRRELRYSFRLPGEMDPRPFELRSFAASGVGMARGAAQAAAKPAAADPAAAGAAAPNGAIGSGPPAPMPATNLRFFDLETTGLSGGSGTVAFLAAVGRVKDGSFSVVQFFLEDYPGEPVWLAALLEELGEETSLVT
ncbi:MAG: hypothetical protein JNG85_16435, partial [Spirochaetaceae bacterium]|nr:hypothetical protein [Spirochaetaceae bacterium]